MVIKRKKILITSILLVFPTYVMSSFLVPLEICESLASAILQFWRVRIHLKEESIRQNGRNCVYREKGVELDSV